MRESLFQNGLPEDSANLIVVPGPQLEQVLRSGQVDISAFGYWQTTFTGAALQNGGLRAVFDDTDILGDNLGRVHRAAPRLDPGAPRGSPHLCRAIGRALEFARENIEETREIFARVLAERGENAEVAQFFAATACAREAGGRTRHPVLDRRCGTSGRRAAGPTGRRRHPLCDGRWPGHQLKAGQMGEVDTIRRGEVTVRDLSKSFALNGQRLNVLRNLSLDIRGERRWPSSAPRAAARPPRFCGCWRASRPPTVAGLLIDGHEVRGVGTERSIIFQEPRLLPWLTVLGNVSFGLAVRGVAGTRRKSAPPLYPAGGPCRLRGGLSAAVVRRHGPTCGDRPRPDRSAGNLLLDERLARWMP